MCFYSYLTLCLFCDDDQALQTGAYNHFTAIYYLLLDKLKHRSGGGAGGVSSVGGGASTQAEGRSRRPSSIADQAMINSSSSPSHPALADTRQGPFSQTTDCITLPEGVSAASVGQAGAATPMMLSDMETLQEVMYFICGPRLNAGQFHLQCDKVLLASIV